MGKDAWVSICPHRLAAWLFNFKQSIEPSQIWNQWVKSPSSHPHKLHVPFRASTYPYQLSTFSIIQTVIYTLIHLNWMILSHPSRWTKIRKKKKKIHAVQNHFSALFLSFLVKRKRWVKRNFHIFFNFMFLFCFFTLFSNSLNLNNANLFKWNECEFKSRFSV